jgi:hypothetical protein
MGQRVDGELLSYCCKCEVLRVASTAGCPPSLAYAMSRTIMCAHRIMYVNVFSIPSKWLGSRLEYGAFCSAGKGFVPSSGLRFLDGKGGPCFIVMAESWFCLVSLCQMRL